MISVGKHFKSRSHLAAAYAEKRVAEFLATKGFRTYNPRLAGYDVKAINKDTGEIIKIEVKYARKGKDGKWRATTYKKNSTDCKKSDYIVFLCQKDCCGGDCIPFIIPVSEHNQTFICITSNPETYNGKFAKYRNAWEYIL